MKVTGKNYKWENEKKAPGFFASPNTLPIVDERQGRGYVFGVADISECYVTTSRGVLHAEIAFSGQSNYTDVLPIERRDGRLVGVLK
jgi:hypothetical protein